MIAAVALIVLAAIAIGAATYFNALVPLVGAGALAVVLGALATRLMYSEVVETRVIASEDLADQAYEYQSIAVQTSAESQRAIELLEHQVGKAHEGIEFLVGMLDTSENKLKSARKLAADNAMALKIQGLETDEAVARADAAEELAAEQTARVDEISAQLTVQSTRAEVAEGKLAEANIRIVELEMVVTEQEVALTAAQVQARHTA
jgi:hypothetical protein